MFQIEGVFECVIIALYCGEQKNGDEEQGYGVESESDSRKIELDSEYFLLSNSDFDYTVLVVSCHGSQEAST